MIRKDFTYLAQLVKGEPFAYILQNLLIPTFKPETDLLTAGPGHQPCEFCTNLRTIY
jgi:hypothetical protein